MERSPGGSPGRPPGVTGPIGVTGATGLVGRALTRSLLRDGVEVRAFSRDPSRLPADLRAHGRRWPPRPEDLAVAGVVNLLGEPVVGRWTAKKKAAIVSSRVEGTRALVDAIGALPEAQRPRVLVSASAIGVYGDRGDEVLSEDARPGDDFLADVCVRWEREALRAETLGVRVVLPRIGLVMGRAGGSLAAMLPVFRMGLGGPIGPGTQWWPWIDLTDLIGLIRFALEHEEVRGPLNATAPTPVRQREFAETLGRVVHRPAFLPAPSLALRAAMSGFANEILASRRVVPTQAERVGYPFRFTTLEPCLRDAIARE